MSALTVTAVRLERTVTGHLTFVLIDARGPRGSVREFCISFDRHGALHGAIQTRPTVVYFDPRDLDPAIRTAAIDCYQKEMNR